MLAGDVPNHASPPSGCNFRTRCFKAEERCVHDEPGLAAGQRWGHPSACHFASPAEVLTGSTPGARRPAALTSTPELQAPGEVLDG